MYHHSSCIKFFELSRECLLDCHSVNLKRLSKSNVCNYKPGQTIPGGVFRVFVRVRVNIILRQVSFRGRLALQLI